MRPHISPGGGRRAAHSIPLRSGAYLPRGGANHLSGRGLDHKLAPPDSALPQRLQERARRRRAPPAQKSSASSRPRSGRAASPLAESSSGVQPSEQEEQDPRSPRSRGSAHSGPQPRPEVMLLQPRSRPLVLSLPHRPALRPEPRPSTISLTAAGLPASLRTRLAVGLPRRCLRLRVGRGDACSAALGDSVRKHLPCRMVMFSSRAFPARSCRFLHGIYLGFPS